VEAVDVLKKALAAVEEAALPQDLRLAGFERAIEMIAGGTAARPRSVAGQDGGSASGHGEETNGRRSGEALGSRLAKIEGELGLAGGQVERLFDEHEGDLQFVGNLENLGTSKAAKVSSLVVLYVIARQAGGYDDGPTTDIRIRQEIDRHGLLDTGNYNKHITPLKSYLNFNGQGRALIFKPKYEGRLKAKELAKQALAD
jgi:hypothetical protein